MLDLLKKKAKELIYDLEEGIGEHFLIKKFHEDKELSHARFSQCLSCPFMNEEQRYRCELCRCHMHKKVDSETHFNPFKARKEKTHCPVGRWGDKEIANYYRRLDGIPELK
jgi:hypothetical protein